MKDDTVTYRCLLCEEEKACRLASFHADPGGAITVIVPLCQDCLLNDDLAPRLSRSITGLVLGFKNANTAIKEACDGKQK